MISKIAAYLRAGLDESLAQYMKHLLGAVLVAAAQYTDLHLSHQGTVAMRDLAPLVLGIPAVPALIRWLSTLPETVTVTPVPPVTPEFVGTDAPQA